MQKLMKTTGLLFILLLMYSNSFGGGWQNYLAQNFPESYPGVGQNSCDDYLPTKDGGVLFYTSGSSLTVGYGYGHVLIKFDKFGNIQWRNTTLKDERVVTDTAELFFFYNRNFGGIKKVIEINNDRYLVVHNGPTIQNGFNWTYLDSIRIFTILDKNGNKLSSKYNISDKIVAPGNIFINSSFIYYDSSSNNYLLYEQLKVNTIGINRYDTAFNILNKSSFTIDTASMRNSIVCMNRFDSLVFLSEFTYGYIERFMVYDLNGNMKYKISSVSAITLPFIIDTLKNFYPSCNSPEIKYYSSANDFYFDANRNLHLFSLVLAQTLYDPIAQDTAGCYNIFWSLLHLELDINGNVIKRNLTKLKIKPRFNNYTYISSVVPLVARALPNKTNSCNLFIHESDYLQQHHFPNDSNSLRFYYYGAYDINNNIASLNKVNNSGNLENLFPYSFAYFLPEKKSKTDNSFYMAFNDTKYMDSGHGAYGIHGILKIDSLGNINTHQIQGNVFADQNANCIKNTTDKNLPQVTVTAQNNNNTVYTSSDNNGNYNIGVGDSGLYTVKAQPNINYPLFTQNNCPIQTSYAYVDSFTIDTINLNLKPTILCPNMYVDISTPRLRRCFSNTYTVNYKNNGSIASPNTYVDITLDRFLTVNTASKPYTNLGNNVLRFQLGNVDYLASGSFTIDVTVRCDSTVLGQTHCVEAHIYPDTVCAVANYNGPVISASAQCKFDSIEFKLKNTGGNMPAIKRYIVIEDNLNRINGNYQLNTNQEKLITVKSDSGKTYRIIAEQDDNFPSALGDKFATAFIEGCNPINNTFTTGFVTQYPEFDGQPYASTDCQQNIGAYDPNDKTGYPIGVSSNHNIEKNTALDYHINFQNTGTDTAFKVVVVDTISKYLDINTIEPGASSHLYTFMRTDSNTIKFIFENIRLVDSNKNEKLSHGFVKFRIQQKSNNANGTKIYNQAEIYFDFNSPIFTNTTTHSIGDVYIRLLSATINPKYIQANIKVYPNPFREIATIDLQNLEPQRTSIILFDISGKEILQMQSNTNKYEINGNTLEKGMYLFKIKNDNEEIASGKLMLQ